MRLKVLYLTREATKSSFIRSPLDLADKQLCTHIQVGLVKVYLEEENF